MKTEIRIQKAKPLRSSIVNPRSSTLIGREIFHLQTTTSTNDEIEKLARQGAGEGVVVFADEQTRGRGRMGRVWSAPRGKDLLFSVLLRPPSPSTHSGQGSRFPMTRLTVLAAVAVARVIEKWTLEIRPQAGIPQRGMLPPRVSIKWPNDVLLDGKKVAGILVEIKSQAGTHVPLFASSEIKKNLAGGTGVPACESIKKGITDFTIARRNLPHWQDGGRRYFVTFRTHKRRLLTAEMRSLVLAVCRHGHSKKYHLYAVTIMPDHVHLLFWPYPLDSTSERSAAEQGFFSLTEILHSIKSFTANQIQRRSGWRGSVWQDECFDRIVRDDAEFHEKWNYIAQNAVRKELAESPEEYPWFWYESEPIENLTPPQAVTPVPLNYCILGIGLNVNSTSRDLPSALRKSATSLRIATGKQWERATLLAELLVELNTLYHRAQTNFPSVADEWADRCATLGKYVAVQVGGRRIEGTAHRLDDDGALIVRTESGQQERIVGGDVVVEKAHE